MASPSLIKTSKSNPPNMSRIVWVSSTAHFMAPGKGGIHWEDINFEDASKQYSLMTIYGQSKAAVTTNAIQWTKNHPEAKNVISISLCTGGLNTELQRYVSGIQAFSYMMLFMGHIRKCLLQFPQRLPLKIIPIR